MNISSFTFLNHTRCFFFITTRIAVKKCFSMLYATRKITKIWRDNFLQVKLPGQLECCLIQQQIWDFFCTE